MDRQFDVIVVGGGPAGATAAIMLARADRRVLLLEKENFPRAKVCGGCLSRGAVSHLEKLLDKDFPGVEVSGITFVYGNRRIRCAGGKTRLALRRELDACLVESARRSGAAVEFGRTASLKLEGAVYAVEANGECMSANAILLACGLNGIRRMWGSDGRQVGDMIGQQWLQRPGAHFPKVGEVEMHWLRGGYVGLARHSNDEGIVALAARRTAVCGKPIVDSLRDSNPSHAVWQAVGDHRAASSAIKGVAGFPWMPKRLGERNVLLLGDAAGYAEPFTGEGIEQAMRSAVRAARAILSGENVLDRYQKLMRGQRFRLQRTMFFGWLLDWGMGHLPKGGTHKWVDGLIGLGIERFHAGRLKAI